ncbi:outer membrane protein assembly factor BamB [Paenibacillus sp. JGP012]|uniref:hypothetical protein n=1 Tax=Paenibacillus sp. JGP012 TaxID=2735914 RepID=UPI00160D7AF5|nr:hypothetical protein [Paenibacillus sp. JGP012]MBB6020204.1 outer membrane protein assembly factor BamB [Paenibacillus sp. JGP012]
MFHVKRWLALVIIMLLSSTLSTSVSASTIQSLPKPAWTFAIPEGHDYISDSNVRVTDQTFHFMSMDNEMYILDKKTGKLLSKTSYTAGSNMFFSFFGTYAQVAPNGNVYILTPVKNGSGIEKQRLTAYHADGKVLWTRYFNEKVRSISGISIMPDGNLFIYLETASERVTSYRYTPQGKFLGKNNWNSSIFNGFVNGLLQTINSTSKASSRMTYYDFRMKQQFQYLFDFKEGMFSGLGPDGLLHFQKNHGNNVISFTAKTKNGKEVWNKKISNVSSYDDLETSMTVKKNVFSNGFTGIQSNGNFFIIDRKGVMQTVPASAKMYQTAPDGTVMLVEKSKILIYKTSESASTKLKLLYTLDTSELIGADPTFVYEGGGVVYVMTDRNLISRLDLTKQPSSNTATNK